MKKNIKRREEKQEEKKLDGRGKTKENMGKKRMKIKRMG